MIRLVDISLRSAAGGLNVCAWMRKLGTAVLAFSAAVSLTACAENATPDGKPYVGKIPGSDVTYSMAPIPAGKFKMGSPDTEKNRQKDEGPQIDVEVDAFWMGATAVTQAEYNLYLDVYGILAKDSANIPKDKMADAVTYPTPMYTLDAGPIIERMGQGGKNPAVIMSQYAARQYTKWLSKKTGHFYRLPTEAEWEYACRAGTTTAYSFGDDAKQINDFAWHLDNATKDGDGSYHEVGSKKPNAWGLYDMHGNVANFCIDAYSKDWYKQYEGKTVKAMDIINWPKKQYGRVIRGGSWNTAPEDCRSAARMPTTEKMNVKDPQFPQSPHWLSDGFWLGFRIVRPAKEPTDAEKQKFWDADDEDTAEILKRSREKRSIPELGK